MLTLYPIPQKAEIKTGVCSLLRPVVRGKLPYAVLTSLFQSFGIPVSEAEKESGCSSKKEKVRTGRIDIPGDEGLRAGEIGIPNDAGLKTGEILFQKDESLKAEAYRLTVDASGAVIEYSDLGGAIYASQTLCQLIGSGEIPCLTIEDAPSLKERVLSLDISRGKIPTMEHMKEIIDQLTAARYNVLMLYFDNLVIQFPHIAKYCMRDAITLEELSQIKAYCNERNIRFTIAPESFGHMENFLKIDEFRHLSNSTDPEKPGSDLNPLDPGSLAFVDMLIGDVIPYIDTDYLLIHGDEIGSLRTGKSKEAVEKKGAQAVYMEYMTGVCNLIAEKYHKIPVVDNDMFMKRMASDEENLMTLAGFPKNAIIADWGYESEYEYHCFDKNNALFEKAGIPFFNMVSTGLFNQYIPRTYNTCLNAEVSCHAAYRHKGLGAIQTTWGDTGNSQYMIMEYMGIYIFGAPAWNACNYQLSWILNYMDRYVFHSESESLAQIIADLGYAGSFSKGKVPCSNGYNFADHSDFTKGLLWDGYHAHTGIDRIWLWDLLDDYGCKKTLAHTAAIRERLKRVSFRFKDSEIEREKLLLNLLMFETTARSGYMKLCLLRLNDQETAKTLAGEVLAGYEEILANYKRLWLTENRENGSEKFTGFIERKKSALEQLVREKFG